MCTETVCHIDVQRKVFLIKNHKCIVLMNMYKNKMKQKGKRKKGREGRRVIVKKCKSFVKSKRIFWKHGTDAKSLFSGMNRDKDG